MILVFLTISCNQSLWCMIPEHKSRSTAKSMPRLRKSSSACDFADLSDDVSRLQIAKQQTSKTADSSPVDTKSMVPNSHAHQVLQNNLNETKTQLLLCLFVSLCVDFSPYDWRETTLTSETRNRSYPDLFAPLENLVRLADVSIGKKMYFSWLRIGTCDLKRYLLTALFETTLILRAITPNDEKTEDSCAITKEEHELLADLAPIYKKSPDFATTDFNPADVDILKLLTLNKKLLLRALRQFPYHQTPLPDFIVIKCNQARSYCKYYFQKLNADALINFFNDLEPDELAKNALTPPYNPEKIYAVVLTNVAEQHYGAWLNS